MRNSVLSIIIFTLTVFTANSLIAETVEEARQAAYDAYGKAAAAKGLMEIAKTQETDPAREACLKERQKIIDLGLNKGQMWVDTEQLMIETDESYVRLLTLQLTTNLQFDTVNNNLAKTDKNYWSMPPMFRETLKPEYNKHAELFIRLKDQFDTIKAGYRAAKLIYDSILIDYKRIIPIV